MNCSYKDIVERIAEPPKWWDENAVPRYCDFHPDEAADIYADQCALVEISCQSCERTFEVCFACSKNWSLVLKQPTVRQMVEDRSIHFGDPPNINCCPAGATMNCDDIRVLQFWEKVDFEWQRVPELEVMLTGDG